MIGKTTKKPIIVSAKDEKFNRALVDFGKFDILLISAAKGRKLGLKSSNLFITPIITKIATKNKIRIAMDLNEIRKLPQREQSEALSRLITVIQYCKKTKTSLVLLNAEDKQSTKSIIQTLRGSSQQAAQSADF